MSTDLNQYIEKYGNKYDNITFVKKTVNKDEYSQYGPDIYNKNIDTTYYDVQIIHQGRRKIISGTSIENILYEIDNLNILSIEKSDNIISYESENCDVLFENKISEIKASHSLLQELIEKIDFPIETAAVTSNTENTHIINNHNFSYKQQNFYTIAAIYGLNRNNEECNGGGAYTYLTSRYDQNLFIKSVNKDIEFRQNFQYFEKDKYYNCIFNSSITMSLFDEFLILITGEQIKTNETCFTHNSIDTCIFPSSLSIWENNVNGISNALYDYEGKKLQKNLIIESGYLKRFILSSQSAYTINKKYNTNFVATGNNFNFNENYLNIEFSSYNKYDISNFSGIIVTDVYNLNVNSIETSVTASCVGKLYHNGYQYPINNFMITFNLLDYIKHFVIFDDKNTWDNFGSSYYNKVYVI